MVLIPVQRRKNTDLQDSGLIYDHGDGVALFTSELSVITRSDRDRGSRPFVEAQPGDHVMEEIRKMASALFVVQRDTVSSGSFSPSPSSHELCGRVHVPECQPSYLSSQSGYQRWHCGPPVEL